MKDGSSSISVLLLPDHERLATLKLTLPDSYRKRNVASLTKLLLRKHLASLGRQPGTGCEPELWCAGTKLRGDVTIEAACAGRSGPWAVSLVAPPARKAAGGPGSEAPPEALYPSAFSDGEIPRVRCDDEAAIAAALRRREPVVLAGGGRRGIVKHLVGRWTFDHLARRAAPVDTFPVHYAPTAVFPRIYGQGCGAGGIVHTTIEKFVAPRVEARRRDGPRSA